MDTVLRPLELTVPQYACLEVLDQRPGLSSSELARATFVTRQSMNLVLQGLQQRGLLTRATVAHHGKALPAELTEGGRALLRAASVAVRTIEKQMLAPLTPSAQQRLLADLAACAAALTAEPCTRPHEHAVRPASAKLCRRGMVRRECSLTHSRAPQLRPSQAQPAPP